MPPPGSRGRGRGRHGRPSLPAEQRQDHFARDGAPQTRAMDRPLWGVSASGRAGHACGSAGHGLSRPGRSEGRSRRRLGSAPCQEHGPAQLRREPSVSHLNKLLSTTTFMESSTLGSPILARTPTDWPMTFYIRIDRRGSFHTYPHVGGPFRKLQEVYNAIDRYLEDRRHPTMFKEQDGVSLMDIAIREAMYWPDGSRRNGPRSQIIEESHSEMRLLVQALVDKYNDDHNRFGDLAHELKDVMKYQYISEGRGYYHFNFTTKTKRADAFGCDTNNLFFVEVKVKFVNEEDEELVVSCFCMVKPNDNGHCYGCVNNGSVRMKHPNNAAAYTGGHLDLPSGCCSGDWIDYDEDEKAEEDNIRYMFKGMDDPEFLKEFLTLPPGATPIV
ncbi:hypothetical protein CFC21_006863 [Triticum aestivum]|uniref:DUF3615 domain-containing protein n=2 Tax=Triticum aestivum TaxID=4565 RepID=A0A3B5YY71_WHEAT|nr:uncharacterized protein LOC123091688 [Triticum aestivum]KAF6989535.1 hypothetical protein CFC21_006863 [Triticum aestivum]